MAAGGVARIHLPHHQHGLVMDPAAFHRRAISLNDSLGCQDPRV
jgi:hypothetical protein